MTKRSLPGIVTGQSIDPVKLERAQELRDGMTPAEQHLWQRLRANRLGGFHFRRQQIIDGFIVDFYCHAAGLVIELDGAIHRSQADYDAERDRILTQQGLAVMRIANERVAGALEEVLTEILQACHQRTQIVADRTNLTPVPLPCQGRGSQGDR